jgi:hypothetical protein
MRDLVILFIHFLATLARDRVLGRLAGVVGASPVVCSALPLC